MLLLLLSGYGESVVVESPPLVEPLDTSINTGYLSVTVTSGVTDPEMNSGELNA